MDAANNLLIPLGACGFIMLLFVVLAIVAKKMNAGMKQSWNRVAERLGMSNLKPDQVYPEYHGRLDRVDIVLDVIQQKYTNMNAASGTAERPWTRVRAILEETLNFEIRSRHQKDPRERKYPLRPTNDAQFEAKYELFAPENVTLDKILTPRLKEALLAADPPVHIANGYVFWLQIRIVRDANLLERALRSCVRVAAAIDGDR